MSTRSIKCLYDPKTRNAICSYTHFDGYPSYMGDVLVRHYHNVDRAKKLIEFGDASAVGQYLDEKEAKQDNNVSELTKDLKYKVSVFYKRDKGEDGVEPGIISNITSPEDFFNKVRDRYNYGEEYIWIGIIGDDGKVTWYYTDTYMRDDETRYPEWYRVSGDDKETPVINKDGEGIPEEPNLEGS